LDNSRLFIANISATDKAVDTRKTALSTTISFTFDGYDLANV